jgi:hypothetical protein
MKGTGSGPGIIPMAIQEIFNKIAQVLKISVDRINGNIWLTSL